jgi:oxalate decarboxylase/phosphoglucose isomerase-like protein (cupin superfamily)
MANGTTFIGSPNERLQFSVLKHTRGKVFQSHIHKYRPRTIEQTQESWIVLEGRARVYVFDENKEIIHEQVIISGQFFISYMGGHGYEILDAETVIIENKLGDFIGVDEDKEKF